MTPSSPDIAEGNWVSKWPSPIRWFLFLPLATLGSVLIAGIMMFFISMTTDTSAGTLNGGWYRLLQSCVLGGLFVYIGAFIAPKFQLVVSFIMLVLITIAITSLVSLSLVFGSSSGWYMVLHMIATLVGSGIAVYAVYDEINKKVGSLQWKK